MHNLIKYSMQWYCQNLLITFSGHISVGFTDSCEGWNVCAIAGIIAHPHHAMDRKGKNNYSREVHSVAKMLDIVFPLIRDKRCIVFPSNNMFMLFICFLTPNSRISSCQAGTDSEIQTQSWTSSMHTLDAVPWLMMCVHRGIAAKPFSPLRMLTSIDLLTTDTHTHRCCSLFWKV